MFDKLGIGWGNSVLALVAFAFLPAPYLFYMYGPWLRARSKFAKGQTAKALAEAPAAAAAGSPPPAAAKQPLVWLDGPRPMWRCPSISPIPIYAR